MGRGDLTFLFNSCEIYESQGETYLVEWKITSVLRVDRQAYKIYALVLVLFTFNNSKIYLNKYIKLIF